MCERSWKFLQEQVERESVAVTLKASKLTAQTLAKVLAATAKKMINNYKNAQTPHGKQSVKKLMNHNVTTNTIPIEGDKELFNKVARKWNVDYAFHKTGKDKYLLLFKSGQADAITAAFAEYSAEVLKRAKDKRPPVRDAMKNAHKRIKLEKPKDKVKPKKTRKREVTRE
jgi:hypothetical protein